MTYTEYINPQVEYKLSDEWMSVVDDADNHLVAYVHQAHATYVLSALLAYGPKLPHLKDEPAIDSGLCAEQIEYGTVHGTVYCGQKVQEGYLPLCPAHVQEWQGNYPDKPLTPKQDAPAPTIDNPTTLADLVVALNDFRKAAEGDSNDDEHDAAVVLASVVEELLGPIESTPLSDIVPDVDSSQHSE